MGLFDIFKKKDELTDEQVKWNKIWDMWVEGTAQSPYAELMTYQSEINNGGHSQYFFNVGNTGDLQKEMSVLKSALSEELIDNLQKAHQAYLSFEESDYEDDKSDEIMDKCDNLFYEHQEEITRILKEYAARIEL